MAMKSSWELWRKVKRLLGAPAGADVSTDIAAVQTAVDAQVLYGDGNTQLEIGAFGAATGNNYVAVTDGGADTLGSWTQLIASLGADSFLNAMYVSRSAISLGAPEVNYGIEIGTGASPSTIARFPLRLQHDTDGAAYNAIFPVIPAIKIASGTKVSARITSDIGTETVDINIGFQRGL